MVSAISSQDWEKWKPWILRLYLVKRYPLKLVKKELENKGFYARSFFLPAGPDRARLTSKGSEQQYRTRFKKWGIRKRKTCNGDATVAEIDGEPDESADGGSHSIT